MRLILLILMMLCLVSTASALNSEITSFSNNYTNDADIYFTCSQTTIQFNITVEDTANITWYNDKTIIEIDNASLTHDYMISDTDIHEIRAETNNGTSMDVVEWIVTNKSLEDAPLIFDSFSDGKFNGSRDLDPWGRTGTEWYITSTNKDATMTGKTLSLAGTTTDIGTNVTGDWYGTLMFDFGNTTRDTHVEIQLWNDTDNIMFGNFNFNNTHWFFDDLSCPFDTVNYPTGYMGQQIFKAIFNTAHSGHGVYTTGWYRAIYVFRPHTNTQTNPPTDGTLIEYYFTDSDPYTIPYMAPYSQAYVDYKIDVKSIRTTGQLGWPNVEFDNYQFYPNYYYDGYNVSCNTSLNEIIVRGRNHTLQTINDLLNNNSQFVYYPANKTAYTDKTIRLDGGASLDITNETLYLNPTSHNSIGINLENIQGGYPVLSGTSSITITNSTISSNTGYYYYIEGNLYSHWAIIDSTITDLGTSKITTSQIVITNSTIDVKESFVMGAGEMDRYLLNSVFNNNTITGTWTQGMSYGDDDFYHKSYTPLISLNPIMKNSEIESISERGVFQNIKYTTFRIYKQNDANFIYYSDILVKDSLDFPISNATITISNMNSSYPEPKDYVGNVKTSFLTDSNGHTKLPVGNESLTVVLNGFKQTGVLDWYNPVRTNFNYTVNITDSNYIYSNVTTSVFSNGTVQQLTPLATTTISPDESWYRSIPNTYQNTTTLQIVNHTITNFSITPDKTITINADNDENFTASWSETATLIINTTIPVFASLDVLLNHDGSPVDVGVPNATGFISFSYTGLNGEFNITEGTWDYNPTHFYSDIKYRFDTNGSKTIIGRVPEIHDTDLSTNLGVVVI